MAFGRDGRHNTSFLVGSEAGAVFKCRLPPVASRLEKGECKWRWDAQLLLASLDKASRFEVRRRVEKVAKENNVNEVRLSTVFAAKPDVKQVFPSAVDFLYESHTGPVHGLECSPFHRHVFSSCGADGQLRLSSALQSKALLYLEPSASYLFATAWSRVRPLVLAAAAEDGNVYVYDLQQSTTGPVATLNPSQTPEVARDEAGEGAISTASSSSVSPVAAAQAAAAAVGVPLGRAPVLALAFNPRQRNLLVSGDATGGALVWQLGWRLANVQAGEQAGLDRIAEDTEED